MKFAVLFLVGLVLLPLIELRAVVVLDFNSLTTSPGGGVNVGNPLVEDGFSLLHLEGAPFFYAFEDGWESNRGSSNGTTTVAVSNSTNFEGDNVGFSVSAVGGIPFDFISIDLAEQFNNGDFAFPYSARTVTFTGHVNGGGTVNQVFDLDLVSNGPGAPDDFETVLLAPSFSDLLSVEVFATSTAPDSTHLNFDNIVVEPIPEPSRVLLSLLALGAMLVRRRRR